MVPIKLEKSRQWEGNSYSSSLLLAKFWDYAHHASEAEISESRNSNLRVWIYREFQIP